MSIPINFGSSFAQIHFLNFGSMLVLLLGQVFHMMNNDEDDAVDRLADLGRYCRGGAGGRAPVVIDDAADAAEAFDALDALAELAAAAVR